MSLSLAPTRLEHAPAIQRLAAHPEVTATALMPQPYPADGPVRFIEELGLRRLYTHVLAYNPASGRVLEKAGFVPVVLPPEAIPDRCAAKGETLGFKLVAE